MRSSFKPSKVLDTELASLRLASVDDAWQMAPPLSEKEPVAARVGVPKDLITRLLNERSELLSDRYSLSQRVEAFQAASMLLTGGDPSGVEPQHVERTVMRLRDAADKLASSLSMVASALGEACPEHVVDALNAFDAAKLPEAP